jgi:hypothetical protein
MRKPAFIYASLLVFLFVLACAPLASITDLASTPTTFAPSIGQLRASPTAPAAHRQSPTSRPLPRTRTSTRFATALPIATPLPVATPPSIQTAAPIPLPLTTTAHESIYVAADVPGVFRQTVIGDAAIAAQYLQQDLQWPGSPRVSIFVFSSRSAWLQGIRQIGQLSANDLAFESQLQSDAWLTISGTAHPGVYIYPIQQSAFETLHMLAHEYTHAIQRQIVGDDAEVPDWFLEGMAEAEGWRIAGTMDTKQFAQTHGDTQTMVYTAGAQHKLFPLASLTRQQGWQTKMESPRMANLEYAESEMAVEYLQQLKSAASLMSILRATPAQSFSLAFQQVSGMTVPQFETLFDSAMSK